MTEREKRIEEMSEVAYPTYNGISYIDYEALCRLADADYRKADEVKKETATEFLFEARRIIAEYEHSIYGEMFLEVFDKLLQVAKEFGVEVDE